MRKSLVFSPVAHCSVDAYAISVGLKGGGAGGGSEGTTLTNIGCLCKLTKMACCLFVCEAVAG